MNVELMQRVMLLQIFANPNTQTTNTANPGNDLSPEMKTYYETELLEGGKPNLIHAQFGKAGTIPPGNGKDIEWRRWSNFSKALTPLQEGVTPDGSALNVTTVTARVRQYGDYSTISDLLDLTAVDPVIAEHASKHRDNMALTMDTVTRNELHTGSQVFYAPSIDPETGEVTEHMLRSELDENARLTTKMVARVAAFLKSSNAPTIDGSYVAIVHPYQTADLLTDKQWVDITKYKNPEKIFEGEIGKLYNVRFVETSQALILKGKPLTAASETLTNGGNAAAASSASGVTTVTLASAIEIGDHIRDASEENPVLLNVDGVEFECVGATAGAAGSAKIQIQQPHAQIPANAVIYPGGAGKNNIAVLPVLFLGKEAFGNVGVEGARQEIIVKQKGSAGSADPLNQRSTVGWKGLYAAKILMQEHIVRVECTVSDSDIAEAN